MGLIEILYIFEDGIRNVNLENILKEYIEEMGKSVFEVIKNIRDPTIKKKSAPIFNNYNCVNIVDEIHYDQKKLYLFAMNDLRPIQELDDREFEFVKDLLEKEIKRRKS